MRKVFSIAMLIVGTMIGAGFCSGREIVSFFGSGVSVFVAPLCGVCIFGACVLFLSVGAKIRQKSFDKVNAVLLGKYHFIADVFLLLNNLIVLSAMIAGLNSLCKPFIPFPVCGVAAAIVCVLIVRRGAKGLLDCNFFVVPFIIIVLSVVCVRGLQTGELSASVGAFRFRLFPISFVYVSMNMMLASTVLTTLGELNRKQIIGSSILAAVAITVLLALLVTVLNCSGCTDADMPILEISASVGKWLYVLLNIVTGISIFTTMLTAVGGLTNYLDGKCHSRVFNAVLIILSGVLLSLLGFTRVVSLFYPLVGIVGIVYFVLCIRFLAPKKKGVFSKRKKLLSTYRRP